MNPLVVAGSIDLPPLMTFLRADDEHGVALYLWLTPAQSYDDDHVVLAFEDRGGEMIPRVVRVGDLSEMREAP